MTKDKIIEWATNNGFTEDEIGMICEHGKWLYRIKFLKNRVKFERSDRWGDVPTTVFGSKPYEEVQFDGSMPRGMFLVSPFLREVILGDQVPPWLSGKENSLSDLK